MILKNLNHQISVNCDSIPKSKCQWITWVCALYVTQIDMNIKAFFDFIFLGKSLSPTVFDLGNSGTTITSI